MRVEYTFKVYRYKWWWVWECFAKRKISQAQSCSYKTKAGAVNAAKKWVKRLGGCAILDDSWRKQVGPKRIKGTTI